MLHVSYHKRMVCCPCPKLVSDTTLLPVFPVHVAHKARLVVDVLQQTGGGCMQTFNIAATNHFVRWTKQLADDGIILYFVFFSGSF